MASDHQSADTTVSFDDESDLASAIDENEAELAELLRQLAVAEELAADLAPELRESVRENREPIRELRMAVEREEALVLLQRVGQEADTLVELLDVLAASKDLADDLVPELRVAIHENRDVVEGLRMAVEREETLVLVERIGDNADTLAELLDLLDATHDLAMDLAPEVRDVARDNRNVIRDLRMAAAGFADAHTENDVEMYELGRNAGNMIALVQTLGDPQVTDAIDATVEGLATDDPKPVGFFGLFRALFDADVRRALGRLLAAARGLGSFQEDTED
ncbi:Uncharacterized conserved protein YjgD, DUF1641 family [Halorientalis persicus]|uniref:Uncharacterized conserved protein YjgD, DUF1641 family n=1 Tax=Halorientalis persicus TaxID=1367881 RepID=A0A1H8VPT9_9EURY|nr:DUF1641 domain-containing protein [Halorientalis persicus]SEP17431.1 Uncharacterized conserved protein YjgD, DUF1641 family [Halorientalis persicus]